MRDSGEVDGGKVWGDLCREKLVNIAYNGDQGLMVLNGEMERYPPGSLMIGYGHDSAISLDWEILDIFFRKLIN